MDRETSNLIHWAENYTPAKNSMQLTEYIHISDVSKCISALVLRAKLIDKRPSYKAYRDKLKMIKDMLEKE